MSPSELEGKVDVLTEELVHIMEDEHQFFNSKGNEDLLFYYLEITSLEKDCSVKQINALEEKIALGRNVMVLKRRLGGLVLTWSSAFALRL